MRDGFKDVLTVLCEIGNFLLYGFLMFGVVLASIVLAIGFGWFSLEELAQL